MAIMEADRTENAIQRIEAALARIAAAADAQPAAPASAADDAPDKGSTGDTAASGQMPASVSQLVVRHEALREEVAAQIRRIDDLVGKLEQ